MKFLPFRKVWFLSVFLLAAIGFFDRADALLDSHQCTFCHDLHGGPGYETLLPAETSELVCLSCHTVSINDTAAAEVHNPLGLASNQPGYITCRECHDAHSNQSGNIKLVGYKRDGENFWEAITPPAIRKETPATGGSIYNVVTFTSSSDFNIASSAQLGPCEVCHDPYHNAGNDCTQCHSHSGGFSAPSCTATGCHDGNGTGALAVGENSPHSTNTIFASQGATFTCGDCHSGHMAGTLQVPNNPAVGINYNSAGHNGISLGSTVADGATEAEICWNCHDDYAVSEWGLNTDTNGAAFPNYDTGSLNTSNWLDTWNGSTGTTAVWSSANFTYKQSNIQSTHSVNNSATQPGLDLVGSIRCSYCHDVHELNLASGDTTSGKPYLRGSWVGNPYKEDGAPRNDLSGSLPGDVADYSAFNVSSKFGAVPRGGTTYDVLGGYFIDQNSNSPTSNAALDTPDEFAGLCVLCHEGTSGTVNASWEAAEIDTINQFGSPSTDWVGDNNGHAAVVKGGGATGASNLFTMAKRFPTTPWLAYSGNGSEGGNPVMAYQNAYIYNSKRGIWDSVWGQGLRGTDGTAFQYSPQVDTSG
ncbi:MAG: hypothetical protein JRE63_10870, partial [Deltaproteobacteria bacterium]|nr:hypothetical protein [Deltaproteobacteria bacterium]